MRRRPLLAPLSASLLLLLLLLLLIPGTLRATPDDEWRRLPDQVGVIIALGFGHAEEALPMWQMAQRVGRAVEAWKRGKSRFLLFCGGYTSGHVAEAEEMKIMAMAFGVPARRILIENGSLSTKGNARNAAKILQPRHFRSALLVTHASHLARALKTFGEAEVVRKLHGLSADDFTMDDDPWPPIPREILDTPVDAIIAHGTDPELSFLGDTVVLDEDARSLAYTLAALGRGGLRNTPVFLWYKASGVGHITRAEALAIACIAFGVPRRLLTLSAARRFGEENVELFPTCRKNGWKRVLLVLPPGKMKHADAIVRQYGENDMEAFVLPAFPVPADAPPGPG
ncbi:MAG: YdcF family protein [Deltaproteobacteria bacterium]|nr:YdcF family protein [Deltaproteobacteria bacterium]